MKKNLLHLTSLLLCVFFILTPTRAYAKPLIDVYMNHAHGLAGVTTVLVMPLVISADIPETEHFFRETVEQTWGEAITQEKIGSLFVVRTLEQVGDMESLLGNPPDGKQHQAEMTARALELAPLYCDAIITLTITEARRGVMSHEERVRWNPGVRIGGGYWRDSWRSHGGVILHRETVPAYDEFYATCSLKIEIRDAKDEANTLIYGISARDSERSNMLPHTPSLTKLLDNLIKVAVDEMAKKK